MATGLCAAAVTLTADEIARLHALPGAANEVLEANGCQYQAGHPGKHAYEVQVQYGADADSTWWVVWDGPAEPDSAGYEIVTLPVCEAAKPGGIADWDDCMHPAGHEGPHRWE